MLMVLSSLVAPGENTMIWFPPLITTSTLSLPTSVMTWDGSGPTGCVRTSFPVAASQTSRRLLHHSVWYTSLPDASVHMLWGLFMLMSGSATLRLTLQSDVS